MCVQEGLLRWWGWLVIAIAGPLVWVGVLMVWPHSIYDDQMPALLDGVLVIWVVCIAGPLILKAMRKS